MYVYFQISPSPAPLALFELSCVSVCVDNLFMFLMTNYLNDCSSLFMSLLQYPSYLFVYYFVYYFYCINLSMYIYSLFYFLIKCFNQRFHHTDIP